ncbi:hypothetical protein OHR68_19650 [Spirillospora sp. NBC_00431]
MTDSPGTIARGQLYAAYKTLDNSSPVEVRLQIGLLAALIDLEATLSGIESAIDAGVGVRTVDEVQVRNVG